MTHEAGKQELLMTSASAQVPHWNVSPGGEALQHQYVDGFGPLGYGSHA